MTTLDFTLLEATSRKPPLGCDELEWNGTNYTSTGQYEWQGINADGCDSTAVLNLTIEPTYDLQESQSNCAN